MISRLTGTIVEQYEKAITIEVGGVGYLVYSPALFSIGEKQTIYTHMVIRDDAHELYGFVTPEEKQLFTILIGVSGVGPKTGLHMLSLYPIADLVSAIKSGDAKAISLVPGIGKKTAEKIVIDLKDKLDGFVASAVVQNDLFEALLSLGYKEHQIRSVVPQVDNMLSLEKQIATALQLIQK